jgi:hypothetical protein
MVCLLAQPVSTEGEKLCTLKQDRDYKILEELILLRNEVSAAYRKIKSLKTEVDVLKNDQKGIYLFIYFIYLFYLFGS